MSKSTRQTLIFVVGAPGTGKTTLGGTIADALGLPLVSSDDYIAGRSWADQAADLYRAVARLSAAVVEGVTVARLLPGRGRLEALPDLVLWCRGPSERLPGNRSMAAWVGRFVTAFGQRYPRKLHTVTR